MPCGAPGTLDPAATPSVGIRHVTTGQGRMWFTLHTTMAKRLSTKPAREDLTDRELTKIIGSLIGGLAQMTTVDELRNAVRWWADNDDAWQLIDAQAKAVKEAINAATGDPAKFC